MRQRGLVMGATQRGKGGEAKAKPGRRSTSRPTKSGSAALLLPTPDEIGGTQRTILGDGAPRKIEIVANLRFRHVEIWGRTKQLLSPSTMEQPSLSPPKATPSCGNNGQRLLSLLPSASVLFPSLTLPCGGLWIPGQTDNVTVAERGGEYEPPRPPPPRVRHRAGWPCCAGWLAGWLGYLTPMTDCLSIYWEGVGWQARGEAWERGGVGEGRVGYFLSRFLV